MPTEAGLKSFLVDGTAEVARNRLNPWPSVADLFSALTVVSLAALIIVAIGAVKLTEEERKERDAAKGFSSIFAANYSRINSAEVKGSPCHDRPNEQCIDIAFRFETNSDQLSPEGVKEVQSACSTYIGAVDQMITSSNGSLGLHNFVLLIEGHTDGTVPKKGSDRDIFLYNWRLSSGRAAEVLYLFRNCGVSPDKGYRISSVGLAATEPICKEVNASPMCLEQNRRTTMRIRVEMSSSKKYAGNDAS
jgi:flagellar motor protein MotB